MNKLFGLGVGVFLVIFLVSGCDSGTWITNTLHKKPVTTDFSISGDTGVPGTKVRLEWIGKKGWGAVSFVSNAGTSSGTIYNFSGLKKGCYKVTPVAQGHSFNPSYDKICVDGSKGVRVDFVPMLDVAPLS